MKHSLFLPDEPASLAFASHLAQSWLVLREPGLILWLQGDLGAGKTCMARGFLRGLGYQGVVKSPTYTLVEPYEPQPGLRCYHFDLYRLAAAEELEFAGGRDYFDADSICLIEWPENAAACLPEADISCSLVLQRGGRQLTLVANSARGRALLERAKGDDSL